MHKRHKNHNLKTIVKISTYISRIYKNVIQISAAIQTKSMILNKTIRNHPYSQSYNLSSRYVLPDAVASTLDAFTKMKTYRENMTGRAFTIHTAST